ncbi:MAG: 4-alpha-glucanotransferase [Clostridia bacterium]|nr:4-alpha-glucanotransferase [Clostridia bacterium]
MPLRDKNGKRYSGVLCAVSSLPSPYGIGGFGIDAYRFVDFLSESKQRFWQILPLNPLGEGDSPYKSPSTFAGEILYIDLDILAREGLLDMQDIGKYSFSQNVDYKAVREFKLPLLQKAAENFDTTDKNYQKFLSDNDFWIDDYALFEAALWVYKTKSLTDLPDGIKYRVPDVLGEFKKSYENKINFYKITQYFFFCQYYDLKRYANRKGIKIIGDIPFYVSPDSADVWGNPDDFKVGRDFTPTAVAGVPPDIFSASGQLWGNPIYNWQNMRQNEYRWWRLRLGFCREMYDVLRIDHFRAFANYYQIPYGSKSAIEGDWVCGEGVTFWDKMRRTIGEMNIIAEDLGGEDDHAVIKLLKYTEFPNMKILQFGFTGDMQNQFLPQNYPYNCVCYTGTHDNDTSLSWYNSATTKERVIFNSIIRNNANCVPHDMIRELSKSQSQLCIIPMQDLLCLDTSARMNTPGIAKGNWRWRMSKDDINTDNAKLLKKLTKERN